jgi:hypothetical protein
VSWVVEQLEQLGYNSWAHRVISSAGVWSHQRGTREGTYDGCTGGIDAWLLSNPFCRNAPAAHVLLKVQVVVVLLATPGLYHLIWQQQGCARPLTTS